MQPYFTIFTSTYNRGYIISKLYKSLINQTCKDFEWLIIDDGSTDNTKELVESFKQQSNNNFQIRYKKIKNGGKPRAINYGVSLAKGKYFFMVDSDDYLLPDAIEKMHRWADEIDNNTMYIAVGAARGFPDGSYIKGVSPTVNKNGYVDATNLERKFYNLDVDMCEAYKIEIFKKFPMAEWPGEKFAPEEIALNEIALAGYKIRWHKDIIYICDYLDDGLTMGQWNLLRNNPMGYSMLYNHKLKYSNGLKEKIYNSSQMIALALVGKNPKYILKTYDKLSTCLALPLGVILYFRRKVQFKND